MPSPPFHSLAGLEAAVSKEKLGEGPPLAPEPTAGTGCGPGRMATATHPAVKLTATLFVSRQSYGNDQIGREP
jgi:hypothetical protein